MVFPLSGRLLIFSRLSTVLGARYAPKSLPAGLTITAWNCFPAKEKSIAASPRSSNCSRTSFGVMTKSPPSPCTPNISVMTVSIYQLAAPVR